MRSQSLFRLICVGGIVLAGTLLMSLGFTAQAQPASATVTPTQQAISTPSTGIPLTYTVRRGDTFTAIAQRFDLTPQQLQALNVISDINVISVGQVLTVGISTFTLTVASTQVPTATLTATAGRTLTPAPSRSATTGPATTRTRISSEQVAPAATRTRTSSEQTAPAATRSAVPAPASASPKEIPLDVIIVSILICVIVVVIIIGLRIQR